MRLRPADEKIVSVEQAARAVREWRAAGDVVVFANGVFDLMHVGHARYLADARGRGTRLVVGVNDDRSAAALKGAGRPVLGQRHRARRVAALRAVDLVVIFEQRTADALLRALAPDVHAKGTDYAPETVPERGTMAELGGRTIVTGDPKAHASRELYERVRERHARS